MKRFTTFTITAVLLFGCFGNLPSETVPPPGNTQLNISDPPSEPTGWNIYDPDPDHIWNRVFRQFYERMAKDGTQYGMDELDPLLWFDTTYLLTGTSHQQAIHVLDEFLTSNAETLIAESLKRAMFQRDMWAVFDWLAFQSDPYPAQREGLKERLAKIIKRVALTKQEILSSPDNYQLAIESNVFPSGFQTDQPQEAFLPFDIFQSESAWIPLGREGGSIAMSHTEEFPFLGRSVFLVFLRAPNGREATLELIESLNTEPQSVLTMGLDVTLVRRMLLIDDQGELILSPLIETVQIRHFNPEQIFHEFELSRVQLLKSPASSLQLNEKLFLLFFSHGDVFERDHVPQLQATVPEICKACHFEHPPLPNYGNTQSIISVSRSNFPLTNSERPVLRSTGWEDEARVVIEWKHAHRTWQAFEVFE